jgi:photosystem II stability/assembly factor-like uncharacterized protein
MEWYDEHVAMTERSPFRNLDWSFIGPTNRSGRLADHEIVTPYSEHGTIYAAAASGGLWTTTDYGATWQPIFEDGPSTDIGDVAVAPSDRNIVWIGTGEANIYRSSMAGTGVYKSTDGGETWEHKGLFDTNTISMVLVHPTDPDIVYVAASGHSWTRNEERGVYKTTDGGDSWEKVLYIDDRTGIIDLVMDPTDPDTLYAAAWERIRRYWSNPLVEPGMARSGIYKTTNGGADWQSIDEGLTSTEYRGRISVDVYRSDPNIVYAFIDSHEPVAPNPDDPDSPDRMGAEVYRSDNGGESWTKTSTTELSSVGTWAFWMIRVDPNDENTVYALARFSHVSRDGGRTFERVEGNFGDHHSWSIGPDNSDFIVNGNDAGLYVSEDRGETWTTYHDRIPVTQFYNVGYDMSEPFRVYGAAQDLGSLTGEVRITPASGDPQGARGFEAVAFERAPGGEASLHVVDPTNPDILYTEAARENLATEESVRIEPMGDENDPPVRGQWLQPFIMSPHDNETLYHGQQYLFRSTDRGDSWERISPDLTYDDPTERGNVGYHTLFAISESPIKPGLIYTGSDDGRVHVTQDDGATWTEIVAGLPYMKWVSRIETSRYDEATVYMSQNGKREDDFAPYVWKSTDYGETWESIAEGIPIGPVNVIREDPSDQNTLYVGTDVGVYVSGDKGDTWHSLGNLPSTFVHDLIIHPRDDVIVIATHGRGMWAMDAIPVRQMLR